MGSYCRNYQESIREKEKNLSQPEASSYLGYRIEMILKEKEKMFQDIYPCIESFDRLIYEVRKDL